MRKAGGRYCYFYGNVRKEKRGVWRGMWGLAEGHFLGEKATAIDIEEVDRIVEEVNAEHFGREASCTTTIQIFLFDLYCTFCVAEILV